MYNHAPPGYRCPFCALIAGNDLEQPWSRQSDIVFRHEVVIAFISVRWWSNNPGHVLIVPTLHIENIYDMPREVGGAIHEVARQIALAFKEVYQCQGVSTRQHNEPAGYQEVFHYHLHVFPRYEGDQLYELTHLHRLTPPEERKPYADKLRVWFAAHPLQL
jgi:histidine triad (HIT) family protein